MPPTRRAARRPSDQTIGRLSLYRMVLGRLRREGETAIFSHQLAALVGGTPAQVRRDLMAIGSEGSPARGYRIDELTESIGHVLDAREPEGVALVGVGNLGRAIMAFFEGRRPNLSITAAFDADPAKADRVIHGCRCHSVNDMETVVRELGIRVAILTVPADQARGVADALVRAGVTGILNFAPVRLRVPPGVYVENTDMAVSLEKTAYFARQVGSREGI